MSKLVVVDVFAVWCGPCYAIAPIIEELENEYKDVEFTKIDADENQNFLMEHLIMGIPTLLFLKNGEEVDRIVGAVPKEFIESKIKRWK